ncbi:SUKH-4 family immunity protein [Streptomyces gibsoniae]|uniref:SUKH-4 family immunity protein n=1 Tax=Streptomyces gibsoniae TaxID=3075529 RepID=A0ABU2TN76_9ACTN|nr:SUKH-4 family immunity protein [Streptomyces sp. DSM 41699]MDT0462395.1 SUKH-4 family immunity protein [Streptomyces sp. DSM 41699]
MGTTEAGGVITLTEADLYVSYMGTPHLPTGALREQPVLRRVAELVDDAEKLVAELRDQLVIGALRTLDRELERLLLDGATGRVSTTRAFPGHPGLMGLSPLAGEEAPVSHRRTTALLRPLARIARPGTGLRLDLPPRLLDEEFGSAAVMRFEDIDFPRTLTHEPTRRFLSETGLPEHGYWYELDMDVPLQPLAEYRAEESGIPADGLPEGADRLIRLGRLLEDTSLVVDGATGELLCWSEPDATLRPLNADASTLALTVWLVHREKTLDTKHDGVTQNS